MSKLSNKPLNAQVCNQDGVTRKDSGVHDFEVGQLVVRMVKEGIATSNIYVVESIYHVRRSKHYRIKRLGNIQAAGVRAKQIRIASPTEIMSYHVKTQYKHMHV